MKYGYFDQENKEYVITRPDTPLPWINYLGSENYCALISNTAGGYSFYKDPRERRITRYRYNNVPMDRGGRYLYLRDNKTKNFYSPTWQPTQNKFKVHNAKIKDDKGYEFKYQCRHGLGYTIISSQYQGLSTKITYFVPLGENLEIWWLEIKSDPQKGVIGIKSRDLSIFPFVEFCLWDALNDMTDFQYNLNIGEADYQEGIIYHLSRHRVERNLLAYFACTNAPVKGFDTQRKDFLGNYGDFSSPRAVEEGKMNNSLACGWAPIASLLIPLKLKPQESRTLIFILGFSETKDLPPQKVEKYRDPEVVKKELENLKNFWEENLNKFSVQSPDADLDLMVNLWNQYQCRTTFNWSRSASYFESGIGRGMGFRDSNQDTLGFVHMIPKKVKERIKDLAATQLPDGRAYHQYSPLSKKANPSDKKYGDDHLWLIFSVAGYLKETGDFSFLKEQIPFADGSPATLGDHLEKALEFSLQHFGPHGLPRIFFADWNDCLNLDQGKGKAESVMIAQMLVKASREMSKLADILDKKDSSEKYQKIAEEMKNKINESAWDGQWYLRAFTDEEKPLGSSHNKEGQIYLETQPWAIISQVADDDRAIKCMEAVRKLLFTEHGLMLLAPPYTKFDPEIGSIGVYPPGLKENGAIFCHPNPWAMIAECLLGRGEIAWQYYRAILPSARNEIADLHKTEPYVYCQMIAGKFHQDFGEGKNSWLTGSAAWNFFAVSQYILGIRPDYEGLVIDPCIPKKWKGFSVKRHFRGSTYYITVRNPKGVNKGVKSLILDGKKLSTNLIPPDSLPEKEHHLEVIMG